MTAAEFQDVSGAPDADSPHGLWCVAQKDGGHCWYYYYPALRGGRAKALQPITAAQVRQVQPITSHVATTPVRTTGPVRPPSRVQEDLLHYAAMLADTRGLGAGKLRRGHAEAALVSSVLGWLRSFRSSAHHVTEQLHRATNLHWRPDAAGHVRALLYDCGCIPTLLALLVGTRAVAVTASPLATVAKKRRKPGAAPWMPRTSFAVSPVPTHAEIEKLAIVYWVHVVGASLVPYIGRYTHPRKRTPKLSLDVSSAVPPCVQQLACEASPSPGGLKNLLRLDVSAIVVNVALQHGVSVDQLVGPSFFQTLTTKFGAVSAGDLQKAMKRDEARGQLRPVTACRHRRGGKSADKLGCVFDCNTQCASALHGDAAAEDTAMFSPSDMVAGVKVVVAADTSAAGRKRRMRAVARQILYNRTSEI